MNIIETYQGATCIIEFTGYNDDNVLQDLTGGTLELIIKTAKEDVFEDAVYYKQITAFDAPITGVQLVEITDTETADIPEGKYYAQFRYTNVDDKTDFNEEFTFRVTKTIYQ